MALSFSGDPKYISIYSYRVVYSSPSTIDISATTGNSFNRACVRTSGGNNYMEYILFNSTQFSNGEVVGARRFILQGNYLYAIDTIRRYNFTDYNSSFYTSQYGYCQASQYHLTSIPVERPEVAFDFYYKSFIMSVLAIFLAVWLVAHKWWRKV